MSDEFDLADVVARFAALLRAEGIAVTPAQSMRLVTAAALLPSTRTDFYWAARLTLLTSRGDVATFDRVFAQIFHARPDAAGVSPGSPKAPWSPSGKSRAIPRPAEAGPAAVAARASGIDAVAGDRPDDDRAGTVHLVPGLASDIERLGGIDFGELLPHELAALVLLVRRLRLTPPERPGRRSRQHPHGDRLDVRATLRRAPRTGGDPARRVLRRRVRRRRRLVVLCDISGSMEPYARAYVQFVHATIGAVAAEIFTFATRLTRVTRVLAHTSPERALALAATAAPDWRGGTRIGAALKDFLDQYGRRGMARGAVVIILSDGWERGDPLLLGEQMRRLRLLAHRIVWVNPRSAEFGFSPSTAGMAAALPFCDVILSGHNMLAFFRVLDEITGPCQKAAV